MLKKLKKKKNLVNFSLENLDERCIPYACHYDDRTILTKNGELLQVIKIEADHENDFENKSEVDIRALIRKAILDNVKDSSVSFWFHTVRRKKNIDSLNKYAWTFAKDTHEGWSTKNYWRSKFTNEIYITILYEGEIFKADKSIIFTLLPNKFKQYHLKKLEEKSVKLNDIVSKIFAVLSPHGGKLLQVKEDRFGMHSEILEFLTKITCLRSKRIPMPIQDISKIFVKTKAAFGGNSLEIVDEKNKHFAAVFTIKEYHEFSSYALDKFLRVASEYIISQTLNFVNSKEVKKEFEYNDYILSTVSKDEELKVNSGLDSFLKSDKGSNIDYGVQQMTITVIADSLEQLKISVASVMKEIRNLGILAVREDLHMALCFWAMLPGNFTFFRRQTYIDTVRTASFASLHNTPSGKTKSIWGNALTIFRKDNAAPHFFNLHIENNGNTLVVGSPQSNKDVLVNFLLSESSKYDPNILYINQKSNSLVTLAAIGGRCETLNLEGEKPSFCFNPLAIKDTEKNRYFLKKWLLLLAFPNNDFSEDQKNKVSSVIDDLFTNLPASDRKLSMLFDLLEDETIKNKLSPWIKPNKFGFIFDNSYEELGTGSKVLNLNIEKFLNVENKQVLAPLISYCMFYSSQAFEGNPGIIVINDANEILKDNIFSELLGPILDDYIEHNCLAILVCNTGKIDVNENIAKISAKFATKLFLPEMNSKVYQNSLNLTDEEVLKIKNMKALYRHFMIQQNGTNIIAELNLDGIDYALKTLEGGKEAIESYLKAVDEAGDNSNRWIIPYYKNLFPEVE